MVYLPYLILLSTSHYVDEKIYTALIDYGHPFQEGNLICRQRMKYCKA